MGETRNTPKELMAFFSTPEKPVKLSEYNEFWKSLSNDEKEYYRTADLAA